MQKKTFIDCLHERVRCVFPAREETHRTGRRAGPPQSPLVIHLYTQTHTKYTEGTIVENEQ